MSERLSLVTDIRQETKFTFLVLFIVVHPFAAAHTCCHLHCRQLTAVQWEFSKKQQLYLQVSLLHQLY